MNVNALSSSTTTTSTSTSTSTGVSISQSVLRQYLLIIVLACFLYSQFLRVTVNINVNSTVSVFSTSADNVDHESTGGGSGSDMARMTRTVAPRMPEESLHELHERVSFCFVVTVYAQWAAHADQLQRVDKLSWYNQSHFFVFTNLPNLRCKGWTQVVDRPPYRRYITQSRYAKFWAWNITQIQSHGCQVVFYMDSIGHILGSYQAFEDMANAIWKSPEGHAQYPHKGGGGAFGELRRIEVFHKDIDKNIQATKRWLLDQPDFARPAVHNCTLYENRYIGYAVRSTTTFAKAVTECFWKRYSLELDSWRDQPLWCYCLDRYNITPIPLNTSLWQLRPHRMGKLGHKYKTEEEATIGGASVQGT